MQLVVDHRPFYSLPDKNIADLLFGRRNGTFHPTRNFLHAAPKIFIRKVVWVRAVAISHGLLESLEARLAEFPGSTWVGAKMVTQYAESCNIHNKCRQRLQVLERFFETESELRALSNKVTRLHLQKSEIDPDLLSFCQSETECVMRVYKIEKTIISSVIINFQLVVSL